MNGWQNEIGHEELSEKARTHTHTRARKQYDLTQPSNFHLNETHFAVMCCLLSIYCIMDHILLFHKLPKTERKQTKKQRKKWTEIRKKYDHETKIAKPFIG